MRNLFPLVLLILLLGIPAVTTGVAFTGQVLFAMLAVLFLGTLVDAFSDRVQDEQ